MIFRKIKTILISVIASKRSEAWQSSFKPFKFIMFNNVKDWIATGLMPLPMTAMRLSPLFLKAIYSCMFLSFLSSCGFKSEPQLATTRLQESKNKCSELYITDSYSLSTNNEIAAKQVYKIESQSPYDKNYKPSNAYPVYHSFINNDNLVGNIMVNKNIRAKACQDYYLTNIKYFENEK